MYYVYFEKKEEKMRKKLIELLKADLGDEYNPMRNFKKSIVEKVADNMLANGVVVLPYKIGDSAYFINLYNLFIRPCEIVGLYFNGEDFTVCVKSNNCYFDLNSDDIYFTKEEAEAALERSKQKC